MNFVCPKCKIKLIEKDDSFICCGCDFELRKNNNIFVNREVVDEKDKNFYDEIYKNELGKKWVRGLNRNFFKRTLEKISLSYRRERFFKKNLKGDNNLILDIACGVGRDYFKKYGKVIGIDLSYEALLEANKKYDFAIQSGVEKMPFEENSFDYIVSSDFFGHVRNEDKNIILKEINRILKPDGKTIHIIETDSENIWFKIAHQNPDLFQKYFIEKIGGHVGLELPVECIKRWESNGFEIKDVEKIWGTVWPIKDYKTLFGNEYLAESNKLKVMVCLSKLLSRFKIIEIGINIILNPINWVYNKMTNLNNGQGLMIVCKKK